ncbi:TIGR04211 family SH3 domain-containing protein [Ferrimonas aestuarii]|uniref:TIGR04211 family SH3 domain-containing protein n=1 Tax=Ferrimonas aestuarii TaxID=2569539 RepID=A0A4U1BQX9_9GAMM|nr:TIGR04211 family SH3 domain-containing protein [Ferrimonas aestuarii]TKB56762.1 TIGR04211 family SH3 domain-containing protein [Ferrimonas aestuarii]
MRKIIAAVVAALSVLLSANLSAETRYSIADDIYIYLHSGPGTEFRILGSISAGLEVTPTGNSQGDYVEITDTKERTGWIKRSQLSETESFRVALPRLNQEVSELTTQLDDAKTTNDSLNLQVQQLQQELDGIYDKHQQEMVQLKQQLKTTQADNDRLITENGEMQKQEMWQWLKQGGIIALVGVILGLIVAYLPRPTRKAKHHGGWVSR